MSGRVLWTLAPTLLLCACVTTGDTRLKKSPGDAETFLQRMRTVHVDQVYPTNREFSHPSSPKIFQALVVVMAIALVTTILLGIILAFRSVRNRWLIGLSLGLGIVVPVAILWLGHPGG